MNRPRARTAGPGLFAGFLYILCSFTAAAAEPSTLSGRIDDALGNVVQGVEVLVVARASAPQPIASTRSDGAGRFAFTDLPPGAYRVAAIKDGYLTAVQAINTTLQDWIQIVLRPVPTFAGEAAEVATPDAAWALRLPRRQILRELDDALPADGETTPADAAQREEGLNLQVDQTFALSGGVDGQRANDPAMNGAATAVRLAAAVGRNGSIRVLGSRESLDATAAEPSSDLTARRESNALQASLGYRLPRRDRLTAGAFYRDRDVEWSTELPEEGASRKRHSRRYWGYRSGWTREIGERSSVSVAFDYRDLQMGRPSEPGSLTAGDPDRSARVAATSGSYRIRAASSHQVEVELRTDLFDPAIPVSPPAGSPWGLSLQVAATDTWNVSGPLSLLYGVAVRGAAEGRFGPGVAPTVGAAWSADRLAWRLSLTREDESGGSARLGYDARIELPVWRGVRMIGSTAFVPSRFDVIGRPGPSSVEVSDPIFLSDGLVDLQEDRVALVNDLRTTHSFVEWNRGRAEGNLTPVPIQDAPLSDRPAGEIDYTVGRAGVRIVPSGTDVVVRYARVTDRPGTAEAGAAQSRQEVLELRLAQDLARLRNLGSWRFLMAARLESIDGRKEERSSDVALDTMSRRLSAGLSVEF